MKKTINLLIPILLIILGCQNKTECNFDNNIGKFNDSIIASLDTNLENKEYWDKYWNRLDEPFLKSDKNESFRLTIFNSMSRSSRVYRIQKNKSSYTLTVKDLRKLNLEENTDTIIKNIELEISKKDWIDFKEYAESIDFWKLPVKIERSGLDGSTWLLEGKKLTNDKCTDRNYHIVARWVPVDSTDFKKLSEKMIKLGNTE